MAASVDRRIEANLCRDMGQRDPAGLIRPRSTEPIRACGHRPRTQAGHMTASDLTAETPQKVLASRGPFTRVPGIHVFLQYIFAATRRGWPGQARPGGYQCLFCPMAAPPP